MRNLFVALFAFFAFTISVAFADSNPPSSSTGVLCKTDDECVIVQDGCCSCKNGGKNTAILKTEQQAWQAKLSSECEDVMCATVISNDKTCFTVAKCVDGKCEAASAN